MNQSLNKLLVTVALITGLSLVTGFHNISEAHTVEKVSIKGYTNKNLSLPDLKNKEIVKKVKNGSLKIHNVKLNDTRYVAKKYLGKSRETDLIGKGKGYYGVKGNDGNFTSVHDIYGKNVLTEFVYTYKKGNATDKELKLKYIKLDYSSKKLSYKTIDKLFGKHYYDYEDSKNKDVDYKNMHIKYKKFGNEFYVDKVIYRLNK